MRTIASRLLAVLLAALVVSPATGTAPAAAAPDPMVVHGKITDARGRGLAGAWVVVYRLEDGRLPLRAVTRTNSSGAYRIEAQFRAGTVIVRVALRHRGGVYTTATQLVVEPGGSYPLSARLYPARGFVFSATPATSA